MSRRRKRRRGWGYTDDSAWKIAHPAFFDRRSMPSYLPEKTLILCAQADGFCAWAIWRRKLGLWTCVEAQPLLRWLVGSLSTTAKFSLLQRGFTFRWIEPSNLTQKDFPPALPQETVRPTRATNRATSEQVLGGFVCRLSRRTMQPQADASENDPGAPGMDPGLSTDTSLCLQPSPAAI